MVRQFQINHLFNESFATLYRQAGRKKFKFKLVNYSVNYPAKTVLQDCARKTSKNLALVCTENVLFLQGYLIPAGKILHVQGNLKVELTQISVFLHGSCN